MLYLCGKSRIDFGPKVVRISMNMPIIKARKTIMKRTMNLNMSFTVLPREICKGLKLSFAGRMYVIREKLSTTAMA
jgi:glutamate formiminotransferase